MSAPHRRCVAWVLLVCTPALQAQQAEVMEFTGDCAVGVHDAVAFFDALGRGSIEAELNGDGVPTPADLQVFLDRYPYRVGKFRAHWCVTTTHGQVPLGQGYRMDGSQGEDPDRPDLDTTGLPFDYDAAIFYERATGEFYEDGLHLVFAGDGSWSENYSGWRARHAAQLADDVPTILLSREPHYKLAMFDLEGWLLRWEDMRENAVDDQALDEKCDAWTALVNAINTPAWDESFFEDTGYTPPPGSEGILDIPEERRESAYLASWNWYARDVYLYTLATARSISESIGPVRWGIWGQPKVPWDKVIGPAHRARNDDLAWLWNEVDVLLPRFYRRRYTTPDPNDPLSCDPNLNRTPDQQARVWESVMVEMRRVRDEHHAGVGILPVIWWHYDKRAGYCQFDFLNPLDVTESFRIPRRWGAEGVVVWGYTRPRDGAHWVDEPAPKWVVENVLRLHWAPELNARICPEE